MKVNAQTTNKSIGLNSINNKLIHEDLPENNLNQNHGKSFDKSQSNAHKRHCSDISNYQNQNAHNRSVHPVSPQKYSYRLHNVHSNYYPELTSKTPLNCMYSDKLSAGATNAQVRPRKWKMGLRDKLDSKHKYLENPQKRQEKIERSLEKERIKCRVGYRIKLQNQILLQQMRNAPSKSINNSYRGTSIGFHQNQSKFSESNEGKISVASRRSIPRSTMQDSFIPE